LKPVNEVALLVQALINLGVALAGGILVCEWNRRRAALGSPSRLGTFLLVVRPLADLEGRMTGFTFSLEFRDGSPADPPKLSTAVPNWRPGDTIPVNRDRSLRVVEVRPGADLDDDPVLVVEAMSV
jgi:hypothetical protein